MKNNHAFEYYKNDFARHSNLADEFITKAYYTKSPFARKISQVWADKETIESLQALQMANKAMGNEEENVFWENKINKILSKYPSQKEALLYEA